MKNKVKKLLLVGILCLFFGTQLRAQIIVACNLAIAGPNPLCNSGVYSITGLPSGINVSWSVTGDLSISGSATSTTVTVVKTVAGSGTINATISNACGSASLSTNITTITPEITNISFFNSVNDNFTWCSSDAGNGFEIHSNLPDPVSYEYQLLNYSSMTVFTSGTAISGPQTPFGFIPSGTYIFQARIVSGPCGTGDWFGTEIEAINCLDMGSEMAVIYPNPGNTVLNVSYRRSAEKLSKRAATTGSYRIKLLNNKGQVLREVVNDAAKTATKLDIGNIQNGTYFLHIIDGNKVIKKQVIIRH